MPVINGTSVLRADPELKAICPGIMLLLKIDGGNV